MVCAESPPSGRAEVKSSSSSKSEKTSARGVSSPESSVLDFDRMELFDTHPVLTRKFHIPTPPILNAYNIIGRAIATGAPSCTFAAFPRFGKTYAAEYCQERLPETFPTLPTVYFVAHEAQRPHKQRFYADLLKQTGIGDGKVRRDRDMRDLLVHLWWTLAQDKGSSRLAFLGDEMQRLSTDELSWLIDVTNDLQRLEVRVISILFGQPDLAARRAVLRETHRGDILGRFMSRVLAFQGISSAYELRQVMSCYDDAAIGATDFPLGSGCSYTKFFVPLAYGNGWRLSNCAEGCWEQFCEHATIRLSSVKKVQRLSIGMEWISGAIAEVLTRCSEHDRATLRISAEEWREAIDSSGFPESLGLTYDPDWNGPI